MQQRTFEEFLFKLRLGDLNLHSLVYLLGVTSPVIRVILDGCGEKGVDERGLPQARFSCDLRQLSLKCSQTAETAVLP